MLNIDLIKEEFKTVIHCPYKWQAEQLLEELDKALPGKVYRGVLDWWQFYKEETCYWTKFNGDSFGIEYCDKSWFRENGYRVLEFVDVIYSEQDFGEFEVSSIDLLGL